MVSSNLSTLICYCHFCFPYIGDYNFGRIIYERILCIQLLLWSYFNGGIECQQLTGHY